MTEPTMDDFSTEKRLRYLNETKESLDALLNDAFIGDDQNQIKSEFPPGCEHDDIKIDSTKVSLTFLNESIDPVIEIAIQIGFLGTSIGEYKSVYSLNGDLQDELFYIE